MTSNDLIKIFKPIIQAGLDQAGFKFVKVKQAFQPTQQGIDSGPTVYYFHMSGKRNGQEGSREVWNEETLTLSLIENNQMESTWQIQTTVTELPENTNTYSAEDLCSEVSWILQSENTIKILASLNMGILKISNIGNPYFIQDRDQYWASPSFEFTLTYLEERTSIINKVTPPAIINLFPV